MQKYLIIGLIGVFFVSCKGNKEPDGVLNYKQMSALTQDLLLADGYIANIQLPDSAKMLQKVYHEAIYKKYGIDSVLYKKNFEYYYAKPEIMEVMYDEIRVKLDTLTKKHAAPKAAVLKGAKTK